MFCTSGQTDAQTDCQTESRQADRLTAKQTGTQTHQNSHSTRTTYIHTYTHTHYDCECASLALPLSLSLSPSSSPGLNRFGIVRLRLFPFQLLMLGIRLRVSEATARSMRDYFQMTIALYNFWGSIYTHTMYLSTIDCLSRADKSHVKRKLIDDGFADSV